MEGKNNYSKPNKKKKTTKAVYKPKRGPLSKLMSEEEKSKAGIHELSYDFGCRITRLFQYLTEDAEYKEFVQSKQIYRSGTSVGANVQGVDVCRCLEPGSVILEAKDRPYDPEGTEDLLEK